MEIVVQKREQAEEAETFPALVAFFEWEERENNK